MTHLHTFEHIDLLHDSKTFPPRREVSNSHHLEGEKVKFNTFNNFIVQCIIYYEIGKHQYYAQLLDINFT